MLVRVVVLLAAFLPGGLANFRGRDLIFKPASGLLGSRALLPRESNNSTCDAGLHSCLDIGFNVCCEDSNYCLVNGAGEPECCPLGQPCGSRCADSEYLCSKTTWDSARSTTSAVTSCCPRKCAALTEFSCPTQLGGGCCPFGNTCGTDSSCIGTATATTRTTQSTTKESVPLSTHLDPDSGAGSGGGPNRLAIGLGVGLSVGALVIAGIAYAALRVRAQKKRQAREATGELDAEKMDKPPEELAGRGLHEAPDSPSIYELPNGSKAEPYELPATLRGSLHELPVDRGDDASSDTRRSTASIL